MGIKQIIADIEKPFKSAERIAVEKFEAAKKAIEELAVHVDGAGLVVAEDTEAALELAVSALKREQAALEAKLSPPPAAAGGSSAGEAQGSGQAAGSGT